MWSPDEQMLTFTYKSISKMPAYETKSFEELRCEDYAMGNCGATASLVMLAARSLWCMCRMRLEDGVSSVDERNEVHSCPRVVILRIDGTGVLRASPNPTLARSNFFTLSNHCRSL